MGANCCTASRNHELSQRRDREFSISRNAIETADSRTVLTSEGSKSASNLHLPSGGSSYSEISARSSLAKSQQSPKYLSSLTFQGESSSSQTKHNEEKSTLRADLSEGWSMPLFSELIASSRGAQWSSDSDWSQPVDSPRSNLRLCGVCSKSTKERSPLTGQNMVSDCSLTVAAVLVCGHIFHAECLENVTLESDKFDPPCPVCTEKPTQKKTKISRRAVVDVDLERVKVNGQNRADWEKKHPAFGSISRLRRYFSMDSKSTLLTEPKRKSFWGRSSFIQVRRYPK